MRLIDADALADKMMRWFGTEMDKDEKKARTISLAIAMINDCESVDAIPIVWMQWWNDCTENGGIWNDTGHQVIHTLIEDWREENEENNL